MYVVASANGEGSDFCVTSRDLACAITAYWLRLGASVDLASLDLGALCPEWTAEQKDHWDGLIPFRYCADGTFDLDHVKKWLDATGTDTDVLGTRTPGTPVLDFFNGLETYVPGGADGPEEVLTLTNVPCLDKQAEMANWVRARRTG